MSAKRRCKRIKSNGEQCKSVPLVGLDVCRFHGGQLPSLKAKSERAKVAEIAKVQGIRPIPKTDPESRGDVALETEIRRTVAWIRMCENELERLGGAVPGLSGPDADRLAEVLGAPQLVSREVTTGTERGEDTYLVTEKHAPEFNIWERRLFENRKHLVVLTKQWIAAGFEVKRMQMAQQQLDLMERAFEGIARDFGANPRDPETRKIILRRIVETQRAEEADTEESS